MENDFQKNVLKIGIIVHGPEIIDSGYAKKIIDIIKNYQVFTDKYIEKEIFVKLGGTMGRVAVIDNNLEEIIDISEKLVPSKSIQKLGEFNDFLFLLNYGKSKITGHTFGKIVINNSKIHKPVIQIERPGEKDGTIILWNKKFLNDVDLKNKDKDNNKDIEHFIDGLVETISRKFDISIENCISEGMNVYYDELGNQCRKIHGVSPNESIMVNGIVVGRSKGEEVTIVCKNGKLLGIKNADVKWHGVEKLGNIDLNKIIIKTGMLRRHSNFCENDHKLGDFNNKIDNTIDNKNIQENMQNVGKLLFIHHAGENTLEMLKNAPVSAVLTIGDDTTTVCGDILARFNIRIIGITDGDKDEILDNPRLTKGSKVFKILNAKDDDVGDYIIKNSKFEDFKTFEEYFNHVFKLLANYSLKLEYTLEEIDN
ncbi:hypothetical protein M2325_000147 [Methanococcus voltae PS]|uniref:DUF2117 domain-containing protein n=1 Tax=Methanococcus voltae PS TaxID=523842 RepID=A0ABT2EUZ9_METVO|nr:DUF2117 domain-containing protein [Methanococcus voltae]MCS3921474.1 hypothetical protein [Methanococcus voltae PS]